MKLNIIKKAVFVLALTFLVAGANAQMKQRVADRLYNELAYFKAVELYQDLAKKDDATTYQIRRTAECYRLIGNTENAEMWYSKVVAKSDATPDDFYHYAQMLKSNRKYAEANVQMEKFFQKASDNSIAKAHHGNTSYVQDLKQPGDQFTISILNDVNTDESDFGASYYDGNKLVFASAKRNTGLLNKDFQWDGSHFLDLYTAELNEDGTVSKTDNFIKDVRSKYHDGPVTFSNNNTVMYLTRSNYLNKEKGLDEKKHNNLKLFIATKNGDDWSELTSFPYNSDAYSLGHATVSEDGKTMFFVSDMTGSKGETDIWMTQKNGDTWSKPVNVESINTEGKEMFPYLNGDKLYFSSNGHVGLGGLDLYRSTVDGTTVSAPKNMEYPLNTNFDDFALILDEKEEKGYFSSNRVDGNEVGNDDIYFVKVNYPFGGCVVGAVLDAKTGDTIKGAFVKLIDKNTGEVVKEIKYLENESSKYKFCELAKGKSYKIEATKPEHVLASAPEFNTDDIQGEVPANVELTKNECMLTGTVVDYKTNEPIEGVEITIKDNKTGNTRTKTTDANGKFSDDLVGIACPKGEIDFTFTIKKEGYLTKSAEFKHTIEKPGVIDISEWMKKNLSTSPIDKGGDIKDFCTIGDILYDFNKSNIRPDAAAELDKLVKCMTENPTIRVEIGSHTDCRGSNSYNLALSDRRAKSAMKYVASKGIDKDRIYGKGYGETELKETCGGKCTSCSEEQHQANRRTEFFIVDENGNRIGKSTEK